MKYEFSELTIRLLTAFVLVSVALTGIIVGGTLLRILVLIIVAISSYEYFTFALKAGWEITTQMTALSMLGGFAYLAYGHVAYIAVTAIALISAVGLLCYKVEKDSHQPDLLALVTPAISGFLYPGFFGFILLYAVVHLTQQQIFWFVTTVALVDTGAFFVGTAIKGPKLAPRISPKKTISGTVGGILIGAIAAAFIAPELGMVGSSFHFGFVGLLIAVAAVLGDLFESLLKRSFQVKDSSNLLPGHGGFLDRIDALIFAAPVLFFL